MRRNRRDNAKKERIIMIASSVFVLAALTMTGIYMKSGNEEQQDDGYTIDFTALEDNIQDKYQEIAQNDQESNETVPDTELSLNDILPDDQSVEDDLDYVPMEANSGLVEIPGLTDGIYGEGVFEGNIGTPAKDLDKVKNDAANAPDIPEVPNAPDVPDIPEEPDVLDIPDTNVELPVQEPVAAPQEEPESVVSNDVVVRELHFTKNDGLLRPLAGDVVIPFSEETGSYFYTLDHYKWSPAMVISAEKGTAVAACAGGKVVDIFQNEEIGQAVKIDIGDGYQITYGQLENINVTVGSYVEPGEIIAAVAAPTKYYVVEGSNLYLELTENGDSINPESLFR